MLFHLHLKERDYQRKHRNKRKEADDDEFKYFQDKVEFGEVVYEPPSLDTSKFAKMTGGETKVRLDFRVQVASAYS